RGFVQAVKLVPDYVGANEKVVNDSIGGLGLLVALGLLWWKRLWIPAGMMVIGLATFLAIAAAGLSVIPRYLAVPSILFNLGVALTLTAWALVREPRRLRRGLIALAVLAVAVGVFRAIPYDKDFRKLHGQVTFVKGQH